MTERELKRALGQVRLSEAGRQHILNDARERLNRKENITMKQKKKLAFAVIAAVCVLTIGAVAAGSGGIWYSHSSSRPEYTSFPSAEQVEADVGYTGSMVEHFSNGYAFTKGSVVKNTLEADGTQEHFKSLTLRYEKDGSELNLSLARYSGAEEHDGQPAGTSSGVDLYASEFINRTVPEDYVMSAEDVALEQAGEVFFNCDGGTEIEDHQVRTVNWTVDGVIYTLMQIDGPLTMDELVTMAGEVIDAG